MYIPSLKGFTYNAMMYQFEMLICHLQKNVEANFKSNGSQLGKILSEKVLLLLPPVLQPG